MKETFLLPSSSHICFVTIAAVTKLRSNVVVSVGAMVGGGCGRDDGDGEGVLLFGMSGLQTCTPSENPCPLQAHDGKEVMVNRVTREGVQRLRHDRPADLLAIRQPTIPKRWRRKSWLRCDDEVTEENVREERGEGGEGVF